MGGAYVAPMYFFIQYVERSPVASLEERRRGMMVRKKEMKTILPTIGLAYILPSVAMFAVPGLVNRQWINGVFFQPFPLYAYAIQRTLLTIHSSSKNEEEEEEERLQKQIFASSMDSPLLHPQVYIFTSGSSLPVQWQIYSFLRLLTQQR